MCSKQLLRAPSLRRSLSPHLAGYLWKAGAAEKGRVTNLGTRQFEAIDPRTRAV